MTPKDIQIPAPRLFNLKQLASYLSISTSLAEKLHQRKAIPGKVPIPTAVNIRYDKKIIDLWIDAKMPPKEEFEVMMNNEKRQ